MERSAVYRAQCKAWARALELCGIEREPGQGIVTRGDHVLSTFHALPGHRSLEAKVLRKIVALSLRMGRWRQRYG
jgi:hypothetical protein